MSLVNQLTTYLRGAHEEIRKVVWPSRQETLRSTIAVIGISAAVALFFWLLDMFFNVVLEKLIK